MRNLPSLRLLAPLACAIGLAGCGSRSADPLSPSSTSLASVAAARAPVPSDPAAALRLLEWCWNHRDADRYGELLVDDFRFVCASADPSSNGPACFFREDELLFATRFFRQARLVQFEFASKHLVALPDSRPGRDPEWHREVVDRISIRSHVPHGRFKVEEQARFFLVRGDSAQIPEELKALGFVPDPNRWYVERWESESVRASGATITLCELKLRYHS